MGTAELPPGIELLPSLRFRWRARAGAGRRLTGTTDTLAEALAARKAAKRAGRDLHLAAGGTLPRPEMLTVSDLVATWLAEVGHAATTSKRRDGALDLVPAVFMARRANDVTPPIVAALWREMTATVVRTTKAGPQTMGAHTIDKARNALSAAWQLGVEYGMVKTNPIRPAKYTPPKSKKITPPEPAVVRKIIAGAAVTPATTWSTEVKRPELALWLQIMATIGTRPGELCALDWDRVNVRRREITIGPNIDRYGNLTEGKNGETGWRTIEIPTPLIDGIRGLRVVGVPWVFERNHQPWNPDGVSQSFDRICKREKIDGVRLYDLRHFAATRAIAAGVPIPDVAYMLGDNPETVMRVYAHWTGDRAGAAAAVAAALGD